MGRVLAISSQVARGAIGLGAVVPTLQALGHEVVALPTILLSNHPGHARFAGERVAVDLLRRMLDALGANGWLGEFDAVLTGYLPSAAHVAFAREAVDRLAAVRADRLYLCDPVLGDDPKGLYIEAAAAEAIRDLLLPRAQAITPNRFELGFLLGRDVADEAAASEAIGAFSRDVVVLAKSLPSRNPAGTGDVTHLANMVAAGGEALAIARFQRRPLVLHGTGDLMAAIALSALLEGRAPSDVLGLATAVLDSVLVASMGRDELDVRAVPRSLNDVTAWPVASLKSRAPTAR